MARIEEFIEWLSCPVCGSPLQRTDDGLTCLENHTADIARQGYVNLLGPDGTTHTADGPEMLDARSRVLGAGLFEPVSSAIRRALRDLDGSEDRGPVLDLGSGTGYHLERALEELPDRLGLGLDNSKYAARRTARCHPRACAAVADVWAGLPLRDDSVAVLLDVFAPRNGPEIERVIAPGGMVLVVVAGPDHLDGVPEGLGMISVDPVKSQRLGAKLSALTQVGEVETIEWTMDLSQAEVGDVIGMGPGAGRVDPETFATRLSELPSRTEVRGQVELRRFTKNAG